MGYDLDRFQNPKEIRDDLKCGICMGVLEDPVETAGCKHVYCKVCLDRWLRRRLKDKTCPSCRSVMNATGKPTYIPAARLYLSLISELKMKCAFRGCEILSAPENINRHERNCIWDPTRIIECANGCGQEFPRRDQEDHNCVAAFRNEFNKEIAVLKAENRELKAENDELKAELRLQKEEMGENRVQLKGIREQLYEGREIIEQMKSQMERQQAESIEQFKEFRDQMAHDAGEEVSLAVSKKQRLEKMKVEKEAK